MAREEVGRQLAHAEYMSIPENGSLATMPANVTYEQAAPSTEGRVVVSVEPSY